ISSSVNMRVFGRQSARRQSLQQAVAVCCGRGQARVSLSIAVSGRVLMRRLTLTIIVTAAIGASLMSAVQAQSQLERAYRIIAGRQFVDLTHSFGPDSPVWSGFGQAKIMPAADPQTRAPYTIAKDGFRSTFYE